jgi:hypothetical protein
MKPEMKLDNDAENFAVQLTDSCKSHEDWLAVIRYGLGTLMQNQLLFIEIIIREATRQVERKNIASLKVSDEARFIFNELKLKLVLVEEPNR